MEEFIAGVMVGVPIGVSVATLCFLFWKYLMGESGGE